MSTVHSSPTSNRSGALVAGSSLILAAVGFVGAFSYLAASFHYPEILDGPASDVLPQLLTLGATGRAVWVLYALLPFLLIPAAVGTRQALGESAPLRAQLASVLGVVAALSMFLGLARWPSVHWALAEGWASAGGESRVAIAAVFDGLNTYLGNYIGEFVGELALNGFFVLVASIHLSQGRRIAGWAGVLAGVIGVVAALRNVTDAVASIAALDNAVLPVWLVALGVVLLRRPAR